MLVVVFFLWHAARHIVVYQSIFVWILIGCDTPFSCQRQRHCCFFFPAPLFFSFCHRRSASSFHQQSNSHISSEVHRLVNPFIRISRSTQKKERFSSREDIRRRNWATSSCSLSLSFFLAVVLHATHWLYEDFFLLANLKAANASFPMCLVIDNTRFLACPYPHIHTHNRLVAAKKILFFSSSCASIKREGRGREREGRRRRNKKRKSNSLADWSRVTVHIKSNYKCSFASSWVFFLSFFFFFFFGCERETLCFSPSLYCNDERRESAKRWETRRDVCDLTIKIDIRKSLWNQTDRSHHLFLFDSTDSSPINPSSNWLLSINDVSC